MNLYEFVPLAIRTESPLEKFEAPPQLLLAALRTFIAAGNILDQIKKNAFYGSNFDLPKYQYTIHQLCDEIKRESDYLQYAPARNMDPNELSKRDFGVNTRTTHALLGMLTESTELAQAFLKYLETREIDVVNITEECADFGWYYAILVDEYKLDPYQPYENVINKLKARYPDKFSQEAAENRNLENERHILSTNIE